MPPGSAPAVVKDVIAAGNAIAKTPYKWGGGHGSWDDTGYDCSGSVSYALHGGGLLDSPLVSGDLAHWGERGPGRWITIYANAATSTWSWRGCASTRARAPARARAGRWRSAPRPASA